VTRVEPVLADIPQFRELNSEYQNQFRIGGVSVHVAGTCSSDVALGTALEPFRILSNTPDIRIEVEHTSQLPHNKDQSLFDSGSVWSLHEHEDGFQFDFSTPTMGAGAYKRLIVDRYYRQARLLIARNRSTRGADSAPPLDYPLDELLVMHRLTQEKAIELHGSGIVRPNGEANLFVGHSGAGKSTTTRLWTQCEDVEVLSDDRIIVRRDEAVSVMETPIQACDSPSRHGVLRLQDCSASQTNLCAQDDNTRTHQSARSSTKMRMHGTPWHGEAMYASPNSAPLSRIFVLEHGHGNVITLLNSGQAVSELFARSFVPFHRHEYVDSALAFLEELANAVPVYRYAFEPDQRAVEKIRNFHD